LSYISPRDIILLLRGLLLMDNEQAPVRLGTDRGLLRYRHTIDMPGGYV